MRTKAKLASENEKLQFAMGEIDILNKQLQREKLSFENAYVYLLFNKHNLILYLALFVCDSFTYSSSSTVKCISMTINLMLINFCIFLFHTGMARPKAKPWKKAK